MTTRNHSVLTPRERQILDRLLLGETTRSIADSYGLSRQTVKNYVTIIYEKLGVGSRADLVRGFCAVEPRPSRELGESRSDSRIQTVPHAGVASWGTPG